MFLGQYFRKKIFYIAKGLAQEDVVDLQVDPGQIHIYERIAVENKTSSLTSFRIGVDSITEYHQHEEQVTAVAATLYWTSDKLYVFPLERLTIKIVGASVGDKIEVVVEGHIIFTEMVKNA